jgi:hypothetical protein
MTFVNDSNIHFIKQITIHGVSFDLG